MRETRSFRLLALTLLALLSLAFATGTMSARIPDQEELQLEALFLAGVSPHGLCLTDDGQAHKHETHCSLCIVFGPSTLPGCGLVQAEVLYLGQVTLSQIRRATWHRRDPAIPPRGPPETFSIT